MAAALADLAAGLGPREAAVCRELTKLHEEVRRGDLGVLASAYAGGAETRGEIVIVISGPGAAEAPGPDEVDALLRQALARASVKDAVAEVAAATGLARRDVYRRALALATETPDGSSPDPPAPVGPRPERQAAFRLGLSAETRAAALLLAKGFRIVARRWRSPVGEVDLVVRRGRLLVFVEVKARGKLDDAAFSVTERQRRRIIAAAEAWLAESRQR